MADFFKISYAFIFLQLILVSCSSLNTAHEIRSMRERISQSKNVSYGQDLPEPIMQGRVVDADDPAFYQVIELLAPDKTGVAICTSTRVGPKSLLTAGHCVSGHDPSKMFVMARGPIHLKSSMYQKIKISKVRLHPEFRSQAGEVSDLAIVETAESLPDYYPTFAVGEVYPEKVSQFLMLGFGITSEDSRDSGTLRSIWRRNDENVRVDDSQILFMQNDSKGGICRGDSGGPLFTGKEGEMKIVGVASFTKSLKDAGNCHGLGGYVRLGRYLKWIQNVLSKNI